MLNAIAALITAVGGLIGAVGGVVGMLIVARRTSPRERDDAARKATARALAPPSTQEAQVEALIEIEQARKRRRRRRGRRA